jgi:hypothetical protein
MSSSVKFFLFLFYFLFIIHSKGFHCDNSIYICSVPWTSLPSIVFPCPSLSSLLFQTVFAGFHCAVLICIYAVYFHPLHSAVLFKYQVFVHPQPEGMLKPAFPYSMHSTTKPPLLILLKFHMCVTLIHTYIFNNSISWALTYSSL